MNDAMSDAEKILNVALETILRAHGLQVTNMSVNWSVPFGGEPKVLELKIEAILRQIKTTT